MTTPTPVSQQCAYESWNATTNCWNFRSCATCLETQGCMIGSFGICQSQSLRKPEYNYTRAFDLNLTLPAAKNDSMRFVTQEYQFPAFEVMYCTSEDVVCQQCMREGFWKRGYASDSRFCVGEKGCVCIMNCDLTTLMPACGDLYKQPVETRSPSTEVPTLPLPSPTGTPSPIASEKTQVTDDDCKYAWRNAGCYTLRSCRECLDIAGCRINAGGICELDVWSQGGPPNYDTAVTHNQTLPDARALNTSTRTVKQSWQFPAYQLEYCLTNDSVCSECIHEKYFLPKGLPDDSRFCVSAAASNSSSETCVCISNCARNDLAINCPSSGTARGDDTEFLWSPSAPYVIYGGMALVLLLLVCCCFSCLAHLQRREQEREHSPPVAEPSDEVPLEDEPSATMYVAVKEPLRENAP